MYIYNIKQLISTVQNQGLPHHRMCKIFYYNLHWAFRKHIKKEYSGLSLWAPWDQSNLLVITRPCYISARYNESPLCYQNDYQGDLTININLYAETNAIFQHFRIRPPSYNIKLFLSNNTSLIKYQLNVLEVIDWMYLKIKKYHTFPYDFLYILAASITNTVNAVNFAGLIFRIWRHTNIFAGC